VDERDQYNPKKYFFNELKDVVSTTPAHLADAASLYREDNAFSGNLITVQRFYQLPFSVDLHFGYRDSPWTPEEMDTTEVTNSLEKAESGFDSRFEETFFSKIEDESFLATDAQPHITDEQIDTAKYGLSNMLGSIAYMYGDRMIYKDGKVVS
jgi:hypothetical protein